MFNVNVYIQYIYISTYIPIMQVNMFNVFYRFSRCFFSWPTCCFLLVLHPPQKWMAFRRPCALVSKHGGWDVGLPCSSCCQCTNEVPEWDKAHDTLAPISGCPEKTWNTALSHGEKNWPGWLVGLIIKGIPSQGVSHHFPYETWKPLWLSILLVVWLGSLW